MKGSADRTRPPVARRACVAFAALAAAATGGVPLVDGGGTPYSWDLDTAQPNVVAGKVTFYVDPGGTSDPVSGPSEFDAVRAGVAVWSVPTSRLRFQEDASRAANGRDGGDRVNWIGWVGSGLGRFTFAATFPTRSGEDILDMDVLFNDRDFTWNTSTVGQSGVADIQALMAHEWGHAIGLDHIPLRASTMYFSAEPGSTYFRSLAGDDVAAVGTAYPNALYDQTTGRIAGNVTRADSSNHLSIHVVAISLLTGEPAGSALTDADGDFEVAGLPVGAYYLVAAPTVPLGAMNSFWTDGRTDFVPSILRTTDANPAAVVVVLVSAGQTTPVAAFTARNETDVFEPDNTRAASTPIAIGDAVGARLESPSDEDWFSFQATAGERVSVWVSAWHLGSDADPALTLTDASGVPVASQSDVRSDAQFGRQPQGPDLDARLTAVPLDDTGTYHVRVRSQGGFADPDRFYVLFVTPASEALSAALTQVTADPLRLDAGGDTSLVTVHPVRGTGDDFDADDVDVALEITDGDGTLSAVTYAGSGGYEATLTSPPLAGTARVSLTMSLRDGLDPGFGPPVSVPDALRIVYLGPPDASQTARTLLPRRIRADGAATATLTTWPRDAQGEDLGAGRSVVVTAGGGVGAGPTADAGGGEYATTLTAGTAAGSFDVEVAVEGLDLGPLAVLHVGFPLDEVFAQADEDVSGFLQVPDLRKAAAKQLAKAAKKIDDGLLRLADGDVKKAVGRARAAARKVDKATKKAKGALPVLGTVEELAQAVREAAAAAIEAAVVTSDKDQKKVDRAELLVLDGDVLFGEGDVLRAAARWNKAYRKVSGLQP